MIRHISMFTMKPGAALEDNIAALARYLEELPKLENSIIASRVQVSVNPGLSAPEGAPVAFAQVLQQIDFATPAAAAAYPESEAHRALTVFSADMVLKVTAMDFITEDLKPI